jgi:ATP-dependent Clp protease adaptor protein ClpS
MKMKSFKIMLSIRNHNEEGGAGGEGQSATDALDKIHVKRPKRYKVLLHNDDYTTMDFVIYVLKRFFNKTDLESEALMLKIHHEGRAVCGVYSFEIAETKMQKVLQSAKENSHPLKCSIEEE